jgi:hypothetical protein
MYSFIVLGLIPGTNIQITFRTWIDTALLIVCIVLSAHLYRLIKEETQAKRLVIRQPLFAQQLHTRFI